MRFRSLYVRRPRAASNPLSPAACPTPTARPLPPPRIVPWRSLWCRVYARWAATTTPSKTTTTATCPSESSAELPANGAREVPPPLGFRAYLQRKRGERWFLTKRRPDADRQNSDEAEEVEVTPPPIELALDARASRRLASLLSLEIEQELEQQPRSPSSELEIDMASYSDSSEILYGDNVEDEEELFSDAESARDSYATTASSDPFLQRYSSWYSIDDEQTPVRASDAENETESRSPTLAELYDVRFVGAGDALVTSPPTPGFWV